LEIDEDRGCGDWEISIFEHQKNINQPQEESEELNLK
jgi:hypothetical protein